MACDISLGEPDNADSIVLMGRVIKSSASDLILDAPSRRGTGGGRLRRALVHNQRDGLTINYNGDYPGGVKIVGAALNLQAQRQEGGTPELPKQATVGDLILVRNITQMPVGGAQFAETIGDECSLWLCVGSLDITGVALWKRLALGDSVAGTV